MLVLSSPSGAGKTTLSRRLLETDSQRRHERFRPRRAPSAPAKSTGVIISSSPTRNSSRWRARGEFLEHALVFGHHYGTPKQPVLEALAAGRDVLFDIDWQGTQQLRQQVREDVVSIFVLPPSRAELERRLHTRAQDADEVVAKRMAKANDEISHWAEYDYVIVNEDVDPRPGPGRNHPESRAAEARAPAGHSGLCRNPDAGRVERRTHIIASILPLREGGVGCLIQFILNLLQRAAGRRLRPVHAPSSRLRLGGKPLRETLDGVLDLRGGDREAEANVMAAVDRIEIDARRRCNARFQQKPFAE